MSDSAQTPAVPMPSSGRLIATLAIIAMLSGLAVVLVYQGTLEPIARNRREALERAVFTVLPGATVRVNFLLDDTGLHAVSDEAVDQANVYAGYDAQGNLVGLALPGSARGYADMIRVLYGYAPDQESIIGFTVLQSNETPGLGDKIENDPAFLANFDGLSARLNEQGSALAHDMVTVKRGAKTQPWEIDGITGATVSAVAVGRALRESANALLPKIVPHLDRLSRLEKEEY